MRCPFCQTMNPNQAKFCLECGQRLTVCTICGTANPAQAKFCIECGTNLQQLNGIAEIPRQAESRLQPSTERRLVTIMFADIIGSTPLADRLDPEDMRAILSGYFNLMAEQLRRHGGTVEKYIGDAVMAVFGSPIAHEDDPDRAIRAALDMQTALTNFNRQRQQIDASASALQMRIGINTGEVAASGDPSQSRQDFLITGDAVNIAARLQQVASPDTILVGERTYLSTREVFAFRAIKPLHLKGKPEPIAAHVVLGLQQPTPAVTQHPRGIAGRRPPLIGRTLELTLLHANYARVLAEKRPHLITILGAPGIGKSRMVREFIAREQQLAKQTTVPEKVTIPLVLKGRCPPYGEGITYWPMIEMLRMLLHVRDDESSETIQQHFVEFVRETLNLARRNEPAEEIAETLLQQIDKGFNTNTFTLEKHRPERKERTENNMKQSGAQGALLRAWRILLEAMGAQQPLIIVVDDLQWADEALLDLLEYLTDRITAVPILFLCPARSDFLEHRRDWGGGHRNFSALELESLPWEESSNLVDALISANELPESVRNTILSRAEGNPFFVEEIVRMFIDQGVLVREENNEYATAAWQSHEDKDTTRHEQITATGEIAEESLILPLPQIPDTIQGVLAARIDLLAPVEKWVLQHAAIVGRTFWLSILLELDDTLSDEAVVKALVSLIKREFIIEIEKQISSPVEHDQTFSFKHILIRDVVYNTIPRQRRAQEHAQIAVWLEEKSAGKHEKFVELLAYHYQQALATWPTNYTANDVETDSAIKTIQQTRPYLTRAMIHASTLTYLELTGDQALRNYYTLRALRAYNDAADLLAESNADTLTQARLLEKLGNAYFQRGSQDEAWQQYQRALQLVCTDEKTEDSPYRIVLYERLALLATRWSGRFIIQPDPEEVHSYIEAGQQLLAQQPISREKVAFLTYQAFWCVDQWTMAPYEQKIELAEQALSSGQEALRLAEELDNPRTLSLTLDAIGAIYSQQHKYYEMKKIQQRRLELEDLLSDREELYDLYISLAYAYEKVADYPTALTYYGKTWSHVQTMENPLMLLVCLIRRMRTWLEWNRWNEAYQVAHEVLQLIEKYQQDERWQLEALGVLASIAYYRGKQEEGDKHTRKYKRLLDQLVAPSKGEERLRLSAKMYTIKLAQDDLGGALADYQEKLRQSEPFPAPEVLSVLAELTITISDGSDLDRQSEICERAITLAEQSGAQKSLGIALRARGRLLITQGLWSEAESDLQRSLQLCERLDLPWEKGHALYHLGLLYQLRAAIPASDKNCNEHDDKSRAHYYLEQALGFYASLGAEPAVMKVERLLTQVIIPQL